MRYRLRFLTTHPIQYQIPWFRRLAAEPELEVKVLFCALPDASRQGVGFGIRFQWDIPLLEGYDYAVLDNVAADVSLGTFGECDTPGIHNWLRTAKVDAFVVNGWHVKSYFQAVRACRKLG